MADDTQPAVVPDAEPVKSFWQKAKDWGRGFAQANAKRFAIWVAAFIAANVYNCTNGPGPEGDVPVPIPPDVIWPENPFGWIPPTPAEHAKTLHDTLLFSETEAGRLTEWRDDQNILAYRLFKKATGRDYGPYQQGGIGDCVAMGSGGAAEMSLAANVALARGAPQKYDDISREAIYGGGRINIRRRGVPDEGMLGSWAQEWLSQYGAAPISQGNPPIGPYNEQRARMWGQSGVPASVVALGKDNKIQSALVTTADEVRQALANGYFVYICSSVGFGNLNGPALVRDKDGFLYEKGSWPHCMLVAGYRGDKRGFLIVNSWGAGWVTGPKGIGDEPAGSFWCLWNTMEKIVRGNGNDEPPDSFAVSFVGGFKRRLIEPADWLILNNRELNFRPQFVGRERAAFGWIAHQREEDGQGYDHN